MFRCAPRSCFGLELDFVWHVFFVSGTVKCDCTRGPPPSIMTATFTCRRVNVLVCFSKTNIAREPAAPVLTATSRIENKTREAQHEMPERTVRVEPGKRSPTINKHTPTLTHSTASTTSHPVSHLESSWLVSVVRARGYSWSRSRLLCP